MIGVNIKVKIPNSLKIKLSKYNHETKVRQFVSETGNDALRFVKHYGVGTAGGAEPSGGAPVWQGDVRVNGHYRGYLSDSHYLKFVSPTHVQVVTSADFAWGVITGNSTNWTVHGGHVSFPPNYYHKRAVDTLKRTNSIAMNWKKLEKGVRL